MVTQHYRWDFIGLSTDTKPTPETSPKVVDGSTYYCADTSKLYVYSTDDWYERKPLGGGGGGGGTSDFDELDNRPKYDNAVMTSSTNIPKVPTVNDATLTITQNGVNAGTFTSNDADDTTIALTDTTYSNFTGTDGSSAGAAGLVPAPATTDAGKFLKADGTWAEASGGGSGAIELTSANYDYPDANPTGVALWRLPAGMYWTKQGVRTFTSTSFNINSEKTFIVANSDYNYYTDIIVIYSAGAQNTYTAFKTTKTTGAASTSYAGSFLLTNRIVQTTGQSNSDIMSQKAVTDAISALEARIAALEGN